VKIGFSFWDRELLDEKEEKELKPRVEYSVFKEIPTTCQVINRWLCGD
jgi:hypothetical protein